MEPMEIRTEIKNGDEINNNVTHLFKRSWDIEIEGIPCRMSVGHKRLGAFHNRRVVCLDCPLISPIEMVNKLHYPENEAINKAKAQYVSIMKAHEALPKFEKKFNSVHSENPIIG